MIYRTQMRITAIGGLLFLIVLAFLLGFGILWVFNTFGASMEYTIMNALAASTGWVLFSLMLAVGWSVNNNG